MIILDFGALEGWSGVFVHAAERTPGLCRSLAGSLEHAEATGCLRFVCFGVEGSLGQFKLEGWGSTG